ncbi:AfsR/SARP family transcriptional regulator [Amycolatopsis anabasis]|uniref:AfsR/SARP family transcriptional regulator n=1 Tax=Amycolatopsis anabasis TaxID=1840409 RepID=UPI00131AEC6A|nr:BTAD domain-containing putative transcriptional regulator [Amycolatopsis anabasis]
MAVRIGLIGPLEVFSGGAEVTPSQPKIRQLLALLAVNTGTVVRLETLTAELWGQAPTEKLTRAIRTYISELRRLLHASPDCELVHTRRVGYRLHLDPSADLDVQTLHDFRATAEKQLRHKSLSEASRTLRSAVELCRGEALSDVSLGPILREHKTRLDSARAGVLDLYLRTCLELGRPDAVLEQADRIAREDTRHEEVYASLLLALAASGQHAEAAETYHALRRKRIERTGMEPGPVLRKAFQRVVGGEPDPAAPRRAGVVPAQLPPEPLDFLGFDRELRAVSAALTSADRPRVVAVVGSPGSGKTTFCARVANQASGYFPDGQLHVDLDRCGIAEALGGFLTALRPDAEIPDNTQHRARLFREWTRDKRVLVFADNVRSADDFDLLRPGSATSGLLLACPLRLPVETGTAILDLPRMSRENLLELFAARAGHARIGREQEEARALVNRCFGLPLAVSALAAQLRVRPHWSLAKLLGRLSGVAGMDLLAAGGFDFRASVARCAKALTDTEFDGLAAIVRHGPRPEALSVSWTAGALGTTPEVAEHLLERLVEVRLADPVSAGEAPGCYRYRVNPLYQLAVREIPGRSPIAVRHLASASSA